MSDNTSTASPAPELFSALSSQSIFHKEWDKTGLPGRCTSSLPVIEQALSGLEAMTQLLANHDTERLAHDDGNDGAEPLHPYMAGCLADGVQALATLAKAEMERLRTALAKAHGQGEDA